MRRKEQQSELLRLDRNNSFLISPAPLGVGEGKGVRNEGVKLSLGKAGGRGREGGVEIFIFCFSLPKLF